LSETEKNNMTPWTSTKGENNPSAALNYDQVAVIKRRILDIKARRAGGGTPLDSAKRIAADYGMSEAAISAISSGRTWSDVKAAPASEDTAG
jgi:alcohol dehydrogenase YqhD (iron-dependent ADH family)